MSESRDRSTFYFFAFLATAVLAGILFPLTDSLAGWQDGDGILTSLISTEKLTWYFWGQDRFLNFIPAVASFIHDIEINLRFQIFLRAFFAYLTPLGILIFLNRSPRFLLVAIALANAILVFGLSWYSLFNLYVQHNPFGTSSVLFALAYLAADASRKSFWRLPAALTLCFFAYAVNSALMILSLPFLFCLTVIRTEQRKNLIVFGIINVLGIAIAALSAVVFGEKSTVYSLAPSLAVLKSGLHYLLLNLYTTFALSVLGLTAVSFLFGKIARKRELFALVAIALMMIVLLSSLNWVQMGEFNVRYFLLCLIILVSVCAFIVTSALFQKSRHPGVVGLLVSSALLATIVFGLGGISGSYDKLVSNQWRSASTAIAFEAAQEKAHLIVGDSWDVWPVVYEIRRLRGTVLSEREPVYGAAYRGHVLLDRFLRDTVGKGEQTGLCFRSQLDVCVTEIRDALRVPANMQILASETDRLHIASKDLLQIKYAIVVQTQK